MDSFCKSCVNVREVVSGTGSTFMLCRLAQTDKRIPKYPPQPVVRCDGYEEKRPTMTCLDVASVRLSLRMSSSSRINCII